MENVSLKEYIREIKSQLSEEIRLVREGNDLAIKTQTQILGTLTNIDDHLDKLNSKVATHEQKLSELTSEHSRFKTVVSTIAFLGSGLWAMATFIFK